MSIQHKLGCLLIFCFIFFFSGQAFANGHLFQPRIASLPMAPRLPSFQLKKTKLRYVLPRASLAMGLRSKSRTVEPRLQLGQRVQAMDAYFLLVWLLIPLPIATGLDLIGLIGNSVSRVIKRNRFGWGVAGVVMSTSSLAINLGFLFAGIGGSSRDVGPTIAIFLPSLALSLITLGLSANNISLAKRAGRLPRGKRVSWKITPFVDFDRGNGAVSSGLSMFGKF